MLSVLPVARDNEGAGGLGEQFRGAVVAAHGNHGVGRGYVLTDIGDEIHELDLRVPGGPSLELTAVGRRHERAGQDQRRALRDGLGGLDEIGQERIGIAATPAGREHEGLADPEAAAQRDAGGCQGPVIGDVSAVGQFPGGLG